jgi:hypothetical protein
VLARGGFFTQKDNKNTGVLVGGDFGTEWTQARIPPDNASDTAQDSTT